MQAIDRMRRLSAASRWPLLALLGCAACSAPANLAYVAPPMAETPPLPMIARVEVVDQRDVPPTYVGAVMGLDGKPLKTLRSPVPAAEAVAAAFGEALIVRGELAAPDAPLRDAPYVLTVTLLQLNAEQNAERQGEADMVVRLLDRTTGREHYSARTYAERRAFNFFALDTFVFGSPAALTEVANEVLNRAINDTVDKPGFRLALR